ncbi:MAG TPA: PHP domain-containing protein [Gemmatimonadales bacterium]|nr:PHP domain-containing protein [Gemmatimonadales bacterium]
MDGAGDGVRALSSLTSRHIDLHLHSTASDGTLSPRVVVERARQANLAAIALTDHDTLAGLTEACEAGEQVGLRVVSGCEFSVAATWGELHVLGYFLPSGSEEIETFLAARRDDRYRRAGGMVSRLHGLGVKIEFDHVLETAGGGAIGRPHVAQALVDRGAVRDAQDAFDRYLGRGKPAFVAKNLPRFRDVADLVHRVGGLVSAAHMKDRGTRRALRRLQEEGLDAVEIRHPSHTPEVRTALAAHAADLGLLPTGGSDWHGDAGSTPSLTTIGAQQVPEEWLHQLERRREERAVY